MKIAIIGLGYVGLPLSLQFSASGVEVIGLDVDASKIELLRRGKSYIKHITDSAIGTALADGLFKPSTDLARVEEVDAVIICVPTPLNKYREPDTSFVLNTGRMIAPYLQGTGHFGFEESEGVEFEDAMVPSGAVCSTEVGGEDLIEGVYDSDGPPKTGIHEVGVNRNSVRSKLVVLESTTYPGTTDEELRSVLEEGSGMEAGVGFNLAFSPEREDPGNPNSRVADIPKVIGGYTPGCLSRAMKLYGMAIENLVPVSSCRAAEATKLLENIFRSVNIALINELKLIYEAMGIDVWEVIDAAKTKPFGFMPFFPGPGLGGHCIPIDPFYLTWKAREFGQHTRFIELAGEVNASMPNHVLKKVGEALNLNGQSFKGSQILLVGLAYKSDVDDMRESPTFVLMDEFSKRGAEVSYFDPWIPEVTPTREHANWIGAKSVEWREDVVRAFDCVVICTAHTVVNYRELGEWNHCIVDTRNAMAKVGCKGSNVIKA